METPTRTELLGALVAREFDLLVIGGGITGCAIARDAALRGIPVALLEKDDFGSGTSSRSSRLIHGGVRYLEYGQLRLVFEASAERRRLLRLAPHLVRPLEFVWPVYRGARIPRWKLAAGLTLYDWLALFRNIDRHHWLSPRDVVALEPALRSDGLLGGARYYDAATDDARLTLANAIGAIRAGATLVNHTAATRLDMGSGSGARVSVRDELGRQEFDVRARVVVNAAGPWSDDVRTLEHSDDAAAVHSGTAVHGSKGSHIAVSRVKLPTHDAVTLISPLDGRVLFALPAGELTIVGTTDQYTQQSADTVCANEREVAYLLDAANYFFPGRVLGRDDVVAAWAGIRPLVATKQTSVTASREHSIATSPSGVVTVTGGKLTTARRMAADVVDYVLKHLGRPVRRTPTANMPLPGGDLGSVAHAESEASAMLGDPSLARHLVAAHGSGWRVVARDIQGEDDGAKRIHPAFPYTLGEVRYSVRSELACTLGDILIRRTRLAFETPDHAGIAVSIVARTMAPLLGWSDAQRRSEMTAFDQEVRRIFSIEAFHSDDDATPDGLAPGRYTIS